MVSPNKDTAMEHAVVTGDLRESDIKPPTLFSEFRSLSIREAEIRFGDPSTLTEVACPGCASEKSRAVFLKNEFRYNECAECGSVFVSPRPTAEALADYYRNSRAILFRARHLAKEAGEARRVNVLRSHANWLGRLANARQPGAKRALADFGTNYPFLFDEIRGLGLFDPLYTVDPVPTLDNACRERGAEIGSWDLNGLGAATAFEQLEHVFSPLEYVQVASAMLAEGGMLFLTTRTISGFDLRTLWDKTPYIYVPEHLNLLSIEGLRRLIERAGLDLIELSTPGQLDVELTLHAAAADPAIQLTPFLRSLLENRGEEAREDFQAFLQKHRLSSHARLAALKR